VSDLDNDEAGCELGQELTVHWYISAAPVGSEATLDDPTRLSTSFTPDVPGDYTLRVQAMDSTGMMSDWLSDTISINDCGLNAPVITDVTLSGGQPYVGDTVRLSPAIEDLDRDPGCLPNQEMRFHWRLISAPAGSRVALSSATLSEVELTPDTSGEYQIGLVVSDELDLSSAEEVIVIIVDDCGGFTPTVTEVISDSADDQAWELNVPVRLISDAEDRDQTECGLSEELSYHWALIETPTGSLAQLNDPHLSTPSLTPDVEGTYQVSLTVSDRSGRAAMTEMTFNATSCGGEAPIADIEVTSPAQSDVSPFAVNLNDIVQFDGGGSVDPDAQCGRGGVLSYHWTLLRVPPSSQAELALTDGVTPWFVADAQGLYRVQLIVSDGVMMSEPVVFEINAN
jgi:hypothetical protein